jgi:hypothetical protein
MPARVPFLQAICWQTVDVHHFSPQEALARYERGWNYRGVLEELTGEELDYVRTLARTFGSWIQNAV